MNERRAHPRIHMCFEATCIEPNLREDDQIGLTRDVIVSELSVGGCYINSLTPPSAQCRLVLFLPEEGVATVDAEVLYVHPYIGCGMRFVQMTDHGSDAIARTVTAALGHA